MPTPKQVLSEWARAFDRHEVEALVSLYHENAVNLQVALGEPVQGKAALRASFVEYFRAFPDSYTHVENLFEDGEWAIWEWNGGGTFLGEFAGHPPTGKPYTLRGCGFFQIIAGKILFQRGYWDKATWFGQIGLPLI